MANFGTANTWIQDSDKFELYADDNGKMRLRPTVAGEPGAAVQPGARQQGDTGIASVPLGALPVDVGDDATD